MMDAIEFYKTTKETLEHLAKANHVKDLNAYYQLTDFSEIGVLNQFEGLSQVFAQMAFHAQNASMISNIVDFNKNAEFLKGVCCGFDPNRFLEQYKSLDREDSVEKIVDALRKGLKWNSEKSKPKNKDCIAKRYASSLLDCAQFLSEFHNREEFLNALKEQYIEKDYKSVIKYFRKYVKHGFSVALTCDFLKEFDKTFCDIPKPDVHIKDTLCAYFGRTNENNEYTYYSGEKKEFECIADMQKITAEINAHLKTEDQITVYQLDRMIWLICSGRFFLDGIKGAKENYLQSIAK